MARQPFPAGQEAVSPVIGVILMVAITVVLAAVVFLMVRNLAGDPGEAAPSMSLQALDGGDSFRVLKAPAGLDWADFTATPCTTVPTGPVLAGDELAGCSGSLRLVHAPSNSLVYAYPA